MNITIEQMKTSIPLYQYKWFAYFNESHYILSDGSSSPSCLGHKVGISGWFDTYEDAEKAVKLFREKRNKPTKVNIEDVKQSIQDDLDTMLSGMLEPYEDELGGDLEQVKENACQIVVDRFNELESIDFGVVKPEPTDEDYINVIVKN